MYKLENLKINIAKEINKALGQDTVQASDFVYPPDVSMGDLSLPCFQNGIKPGSLTINDIKAKEISGIKWVGPYLNIELEKTSLVGDVLQEIGEQKEKYGQNKGGQKQKVMIEYSNANTHKEYHVGHLRNICYGDSVNRILEANGFDAIPVSYINDFGIHVAKTIWWTFHPDNKYAQGFLGDDGGDKGYFLGKMYVEACTREKEEKTARQQIEFTMKKIESRKGDEYELWQKSREWSIEQFDQIYKELGIKFKKIFYESEFVDKGRKQIEKLIKNKILKQSQGAVIADLEKYDLGVLIFLRSDGTATYPVADIPLAEAKFKKYKLDKSIYVVDNRQSLYFKQLFKTLELMGYDQDMIHLSYDFVKLPSGMMSSRSGNVVTYQELRDKMLEKIKKETRKRHLDWGAEKIEEVAKKITNGAIKFEMCKVGAENIITYDIDKALSFDGFTAAYLQYSYARIESIRRRSNTKLKVKNAAESLVEAKEHELILKLSKYAEIVAQAGEKYDPSHVAKYLFELAKSFNEYYHEIPILKAEEAKRQARLMLISSVAQVIQNGLGLLGIETIEEM